MTEHHRTNAGQPDAAPSGNVPEVTNWTPAHRITGATANRLGALFYVAVAAVALAGQSLAAVEWLHWPLWLAVGATAVLELGGIALAARADFRRRLGERAYAARGLSAAVAVFAVVFNWVGHDDHLAGGFFAGMSALGYAVWLINAGDRRRDQLRAEGKLPPTPPAYELWHWLRHPLVTARARSLAKANPELGLYPSLTAAVEQVCGERREKAITRILRKRMKKGEAADLAVHTYDLAEIARRLADEADYDRLTEIIAAELSPDRITRPRGSGTPSGTGVTGSGGTPATNPWTVPVEPEMRVPVRCAAPLRNRAPEPRNTLGGTGTGTPSGTLGPHGSDTPASGPGNPLFGTLDRGVDTPARNPVEAPRRNPRVNGAVPAMTSIGTPDRTPTGTGTGTSAEYPADAVLLPILRNPKRVSRDADGTVPTKRAMRELKVGRDRAIRLLKTAGLYRDTPDPGGSDTPAGTGAERGSDDPEERVPEPLDDTPAPDLVGASA